MGLEAQGNKEIYYICDRKECEHDGKGCMEGIYDQCIRTPDIKHAKNFEKVFDGVYYEREKPCRYEKAVIFFDIAVICIVLVDIALMLWG